jgi:hypothetical protein
MIDRLAGGLFRGHVLHRPDDRARLGLTAISEEACDAEVRELDAAGARVRLIEKKEVGRLEVAMDDALVVCRLECGGDLRRDRHRLLPGEATAGADEVLEAPAAHEFHREIRLTILLAEREKPHDPRMTQRLECLDLDVEPAAQGRIVAELGREHLDRHDLPAHGVFGLVHGAHATPAEATADQVRSDLGRLHTRKCSPAALPRVTAGFSRL